MTTWVPLPRHLLRSPGGRHLFVYGRLDPGAAAAAATLPEVDPAALQQRFDVLTGTWIAISPSRNVRPNVATQPAAETEAAAARRRAPCPLCPGGPEVPFPYDAAVFDNRYPALVESPPPVPDDPFFAPSRGTCEVVLYTARHTGSLAGLKPQELARVVAVWRDRTGSLWHDHEFVLAFENRGEAIGATLSHPHGQIYAFDRVPPLIAERVRALDTFRAEQGACGSCEAIARDAGTERVVAENPSFVVGVPFAPHWPYEVHVRARRHGLRRLTDLTAAEQRDLAAALRQVTVRYEELWDTPLAYMMVAMEAPALSPDWHLAFEFYPPNRSPRQMKVRASVETAAGLFINDTLPEVTAAQLAGLPNPTVEESEPFLAEDAS